MTSPVPATTLAFLTLSLAVTAPLVDASAQLGPADFPAAVVASESADSTFRRLGSSDVPLAAIIRSDERAFGRSGMLRLSVVRVSEGMETLFVRHTQGVDDVTYRWEPLFGTQPEPLGGEVRLNAGLVAPSQPGYWKLVLRRNDEQHEVNDLTVVTQVPFDRKRNGRLNGYLIGTYPTEGSGRTDHYAPPAGFIEVTPETLDVHISKHLRVGQFLTKDQFTVWPKYVALDLRLIDKLELVMQELHAMGVRAERMHIMSGFRTPSYNGPGEGGRALLSRHTFGDAADVWIENGARSGYIADLNGDGRQDLRDAEVIVQAVERVEQKYPELVGGVGLYRELGARGPFVHIDVRGNRSRW
jgi:uncharacterized protein YcbK (DUF882 family)